MLAVVTRCLIGFTVSSVLVYLFISSVIGSNINGNAVER